MIYKKVPDELKLYCLIKDWVVGFMPNSPIPKGSLLVWNDTFERRFKNNTSRDLQIELDLMRRRDAH